METQDEESDEKWETLFKSYYVVWKQYFIKIMQMTDTSLNRTM